jgi:hypothetical protein
MVGHLKVVEMQDASDFYRSSSKSDWYFIYNIAGFEISGRPLAICE